MTTNPFNHERDTELGAALREHLEATDQQRFVRRVMAELHASDSSWDVLSRWARPGIAAAIAFFMGLAVWFALHGTADSPATLADAVRPSEAPAPLFSSARPDHELMLEAVFER
jgi:hypothetical protein